MVESAPQCPKCDQPMRLARVVPAVAGHPELRTFECGACREVRTEVVPHKSGPR